MFSISHVFNLISFIEFHFQQRKNQHTILSKLQAEKVDFIKIDVTDPKHNQEKLHMRELSKSRKEGTFAVPPQIFNDSEYCGVSFEKAITLNFL